MRWLPSWCSRVSPSWINPALGFMLLIICGVVGNAVFSARQGDLARAAEDAANMSAVLSQDIKRNLELLDLSLIGAVENVGKPEVMSAPKPIRQLVLFDRAATASYLGHMLVLDTKGNVVADSATLTPSAINYADRDYFQIHAQRPDLGLFISRPLRSRADGNMILALSRRVENPDGSFGGVVVGTIKLDYFHDLFRQLKLRPGGSLTLFRNDGTLLMRDPYDPSMIGAHIDPPQLFDRASRAADGQYEAYSAVDGVDRLYHFHRIGALPLIQNVGLSMNDIYEQWRWRTATNVAILVLCCAVISLLTVLLGRELKRRAAAEAALQNLSEHDALTGLANRRCFDRVLAVEWSRAARDGKPLAFMMIDADQFKLYNDTLGHPAGDVALIRLASCIAAGARRPGDLAVRYGGEEFAILLPQTDAAGAMTVAEGIRLAVMRLRIDHPKSALGLFTISVGVVSLIPYPGQPATDLIAAADAALYRSKNAGRNRSTGMDPAPALKSVA